MDSPVNPDSRALPEGWFQHYDASYYVQTNVMPPKISFTHPLGAVEEVKSMSPPAPHPAKTIPSPPVTPEAPRPLPSPASKLSPAQMLYASANRTATPTSSFIGGNQTLSPLNERATLTPRALPKPPLGGRPQNGGIPNHSRSSTLGMPLQQQTLPASMNHLVGPSLAGSNFPSKRSASYPSAPSFQSTALPNRVNNVGSTGGSSAQNPTQQATANLISASQVPTPLLFSSAPPSGTGYQQSQTSTSPTGQASNQTLPGSSGPPNPLLSAAQVPSPPLFSSAPPAGGASQNAFPSLPAGQVPVNNTGSSMGTSSGTASVSTNSNLASTNMVGKPPYFAMANNAGKPPNLVSPISTGNAQSFMLPNTNASNFTQTNFTGNPSQVVSPSSVGVSPLSSPPLNMNGQLGAMSPNGLPYNMNSTLVLNANAKPPKMDHAAMSQSVKENARQTAEALRQAGRAVGNATKKVAASTANRFLLGVDFLNPKTGKPTVDQVTLQAIYQGQPGADYSGAINALLIQQQQQPTKTAHLQVNAQVELGGLQFNAQYSKPGQQSPNAQHSAQSPPAQQQQQQAQQQQAHQQLLQQQQAQQQAQQQQAQQQQKQQQLLQQQLAQQQAANQQLMTQLQQQQQQQQQLQQQQFQQLQQQQLEQAQQQQQIQQQQQQAGQNDLMQQLLLQAEAAANQQFDAQLQQQMLLMQQQSQAANQAVYEVQLQQTLTVGVEQQPAMLTQAQEATGTTGGLEGMFGGFDPSQMLSGLSGGMDLSSLTGGVDLSSMTSGVDLSSMTSGMDLSSLTGGLESSLSGLSLEF
ncbi:hypothetical protein BKA70DRAFT_1259013 [Coprinopsis sp. MPI-PUGE-AT-0042]|nr:hypothetical protein BKA70DRAFT_1259013 [Coprinopsis sp. MPI-PUGE-AT-0042]